MRRVLLGLLPEGFRREFGEDLVLTLQAAAAERRGIWATLRFWARELGGWAGLVLRLHARRETPPENDATGRALTVLIGGRRGVPATLVAAGSGGLAFWIGGELVASHGIYWRAAHPVAALTIAVLGAALGWELAGARTGRQRLRRCSLLLLLLLSTLPTFRAVDHLYLTHAAGREQIALTLPGIELTSVRLKPGQPVPKTATVSGFQATRLYGSRDRGQLLTIWVRHPGAPPYLALGFGLLLASSLVAYSARHRLSAS